LLRHEHLLVRAEVANPPTCPKFIESWLANLVRSLGMKIMIGPIAEYSNVVGNEGVTGVVVLNTSHSCVHVWHLDSPAVVQLDVYSCAAIDKQLIFNLLEEFRPTHIDYKFLDREKGFKEIL